jgi:hypothetical protein
MKTTKAIGFANAMPKTISEREGIAGIARSPEKKATATGSLGQMQS